MCPVSDTTMLTNFEHGVSQCLRIGHGLEHKSKHTNLKDMLMSLCIKKVIMLYIMNISQKYIFI